MSDGRQPRREPQSSSIWLTIFSDMTTNLMLFFLMLFSMSRMTHEDRSMMIQGLTHEFSDPEIRMEAERKSKAEEKRQAQAIENLRDVVYGGELQGNAYLEEDERSLKITLSPLLFFQLGSSEMSLEARRLLARLAEPLKEFHGDIIIEGHTDNVPMRGGRYPSNWELSVARAVSVMEYLVSLGVDNRRLVAGGYGEYHPAFPNDTPENQARNRRIEITIMKFRRSA